MGSSCNKNTLNDNHESKEEIKEKISDYYPNKTKNIEIEGNNIYLGKEKKRENYKLSPRTILKMKHDNNFSGNNSM